MGRLLSELATYSHVSSREHREVLFGAIRLFLLNIPESLARKVVHELSLLRPFLQYMAL